MSCCSFISTNQDMTVCIDALLNRKKTSYDEVESAIGMFRYTLDIMMKEGIIKQYDLSRLIVVCEEMQK